MASSGTSCLAKRLMAAVSELGLPGLSSNMRMDLSTPVRVVLQQSASKARVKRRRDEGERIERGEIVERRDSRERRGTRGRREKERERVRRG